jgi:hypothetical protein
MAIVAAIAVPLLGASVAQADRYSCAFTGAAGPIMPGVTDIEADLADGDRGDGTANPITGDPRLDDTDEGTAANDGTYGFTTAGAATGAAACIGVNDDQGRTGWPSQLPADGDTGDITSSGDYNNQICGTGTATSRPGTTITSDNGRMPGVSDATYGIVFIAGQGQLDISSISGPPSTPPGYTNANGPEGVVNITPTHGNCINEPVTEFQATGAFTVHIPFV